MMGFYYKIRVFSFYLSCALPMRYIIERNQNLAILLPRFRGVLCAPMLSMLHAGSIVTTRIALMVIWISAQ